MRAILNANFKTVFYYEDEHFETDDDCVADFRKGDEVEVLKIVEDSTYGNGKAYVILNTVNNESITIHGGVLDFINE